MHLEDNALSGSGCCGLSGSSDGPFVVTDYIARPEWVLNGRVYVNCTVAREIGEAAGNVRPETHAQALGSLAEAHADVAELERRVAELEAENEALIVLVGGKMGARANHIRKEAGFKARQAFDKTRDFVNDAEIGETEADISAAYELANA